MVSNLLNYKIPIAFSYWKNDKFQVLISLNIMKPGVENLYTFLVVSSVLYNFLNVL